MHYFGLIRFVQFTFSKLPCISLFLYHIKMCCSILLGCAYLAITNISGLYYKHLTIVNDDSIIISEWMFKLIDDPIIVIYTCNMFIIQATGNTKGGSITVPLTSGLTGLQSAVWQLTIFVFIRKTGSQRHSDASPFSIPCQHSSLLPPAVQWVFMAQAQVGVGLV